MRIAFVGKGGSGKTSHAALFTMWLAARNQRVLAVDADINVHLPGFFGYDAADVPHLSTPGNAAAIKNWLRADNARIAPGAFRKTTPPGRGSRLITWQECASGALRHCFVQQSSHLLLTAVGTYEEEHIGASCYHNHLAILENVLSHFHDPQAVFVADMVAGTDAFASSLYMQFDLLVLLVEPTRRGIAVYGQFKHLMEQGGMAGHLLVLLNRTDTPQQRELAESCIPEADILATVPSLGILAGYDMTGEIADRVKIEKIYDAVGAKILLEAQKREIPAPKRLQLLHDVHRRYVSQDFVRRAHGDLTSQIDPDFTFPA